MGFWSSQYQTPHPADHIGYWGPITSTIDWCEENYIISPFFAEFINSVTNFSFFILSMYHLYNAIIQRHGPLFWFVSIGMGFVGFGSFLFHMTLRYEFQLMDELPMIYVTAIPSAYLFGYKKSNFGKKLTYLLVLLFMVALTVVYVFIYKDPIIHQICYAALNFAIIYKTLVIINELVPDKETRHYLFKLLLSSFALFAFGFFVWNLDNELCHHLIHARRQYLGWPAGILLEGHGWWHVFTSLGIYNFILYIELVVTWMEQVQDNYQLSWKFHRLVGVVVLKDDKKFGIADKQGYGKLDPKKLN